MTKRLSIILSAVALLISCLGVTSIGQAAERAVAKVVPYAKVAGQANNAARLNGHRSSTAPVAGQIPVLDGNGKLSSSIGAVGPQGPAGPQGDPGAKGDKGDPATRLWAIVNWDGTIVNGSGVTGARHVGTGKYQVDFNQDVSRCAQVGTVVSATPFQMALVGVPGRPQSIGASLGSVAGPGDGEFHLAVFC